MLFREEQRYKKPRIRYILTAMVVIMIVSTTFLIRQLLSTSPDDTANENERIVLITATIFLILFTIGFVSNFSRLKMITKITERGIQVSYPPILRKGRIIARGDVQRFEIRQYNPLIEFGGWGIKTRGRPFRRRQYGSTLTAYGRSGLQLYLRNGKKLLIGTQRPQALRHAVEKMLSGDIGHKQKKLNN